MSSYRAELTGLTSVLFILHWVCTQEHVDDGTITIYCDNDAALNETFHKGIPSNNPYSLLAADRDLITLARDLLLQLPVTVNITHQWVKGHYKGKKELWHELNHIADELAGTFNASDRPSANSFPLLPPIYEAELINCGHLITSRLTKVISSALHDHCLQTQIIKRQGWSLADFDRVDWEAHRLAYVSYKRPQRISISKLAHGLYHTNYEAHKLYGKAILCPCCGGQPEALIHVFRCQAKSCVDKRIEAQEILRGALTMAKTPDKLSSSIFHGINSSVREDDPPTPLYRGSVLPGDVALVQAFLDQTLLGWDQLLRGRISRKWSAAYMICGVRDKGGHSRPDSWAKQLIRALWEYSASLWRHRNGEVYGHTVEEKRENERQQLQNKIEQEFREYKANPFVVSPQHISLFTRRTLRDRKRMDRDSMASWLRSVEEANVTRLSFCSP
jgi:hypothetical protein